jgi:hypothetical protein
MVCVPQLFALIANFYVTLFPLSHYVTVGADSRCAFAKKKSMSRKVDWLCHGLVL